MFIPNHLIISEVPPIVGARGQCNGAFNHPPGCSANGCDYVLLWEYFADRDEIDFLLTARQGPGTWTGVGFAQEPKMVTLFTIIMMTNEEPRGDCKFYVSCFHFFT